MASANKERKKTEQMSLVDPIYQRFTKGVIRALGSTDFYEYFMAVIAGANNRIQFSNRKVIKTVDLTWVDAIEESLNGFQAVINNPRNVIKEEEFIVNVANAKRSGAEVVRHLAHHADLVEEFDQETGDVHPARLMQRYREDTTVLYENQLVFTALEAAHRFVKIRHDALFDAMSDELGAKLKVETDMASPTETVHMDMYLHINKVESQLDTDDKNYEVFNRISRIFRILSVYMNTEFAQQMSKFDRIKGQISKNNVLKKNPHYHKIVKLFEFLRGYQDVGYTIRVVEQNPEVSETFQRDIYHNVLFNYLVLKGYLQDEEDRQISVDEKAKRRTLKPKFIKQIIEELTEDYDLPDVEVRKVLIEELTKSDLMREESAERHRLVEEQRLRKKEEEERRRKEKEAERERIRQEKEAERERIRQEKEQERLRQQEERMEREAENRRRSGLIKKELERFASNREERLELRQQLAQSLQEVTERLDFSDAVVLLEEEETRRREANARLRQQRQQEKELLRIQEEQERIRRQEEEEKARLASEEEEKRIQAEQRRQAVQKLRPMLAELVRFQNRKPGQLQARRQREINRQRLLQERQAVKQSQ